MTNEPEDVEFNRKWHLVSSNRITWQGTCYERDGEASQTANVGAWYSKAVFWRNEADKLRKENAILREEAEQLRSSLAASRWLRGRE